MHQNFKGAVCEYWFCNPYWHCHIIFKQALTISMPSGKHLGVIFPLVLAKLNIVHGGAANMPYTPSGG
jgi:hypothetical protein